MVKLGFLMLLCPIKLNRLKRAKFWLSFFCIEQLFFVVVVVYVTNKPMFGGNFGIFLCWIVGSSGSDMDSCALKQAALLCHLILFPIDFFLYPKLYIWPEENLYRKNNG